MNRSIRHRLVPAWLLSSFGVAALVIVGVGLLGLVAMTTARRTREMGVRIALGATPSRIVRQVAGEQTAAVIGGLIAGGLIAAWAAISTRSRRTTCGRGARQSPCYSR